jgi:DNA modification methylase
MNDPIIGDGCTLYTGDCIEIAKTLPNQSIHCVITSPPYWGLRDYKVDGQFGLEPTPDLYVQHLVELFREIKRVLKDDGTVWLNLGDSYASNCSRASNGGRAGFGTPREGVFDRDANGLKDKDLIGIPWRVAFALQQPYILHDCIKNDVDKAWLAAMFDGEGCIGIRRFDSYRKEKKQIYQDGFVAYTVVTNNDIILLEKCVRITGKGNVKLKQSAGSTDGRGIVSRRDSYGWRLDGNDAINVIRAIYPYLIAKRKQACLAFTLDVIHKNKQRMDGKVPKDIQDKKAFLFESIKKCNQREKFDLPNWIEEPKQKIEDGWYLRSDIIWAKRNCMPESMKDRPTRNHEYIFLLTKSANYYYDYQAILEPATLSAIKRIKNSWNGTDDSELRKLRSSPQKTGDKPMGNRWLTRGFKIKEQIDNQQHHGQDIETNMMRNKRDVWWVATKPFKEAHFAVFPEDLIKPCVLAGCPQGGVILDPFNGAGTTGVVALKYGRNYIGSDINPAYIDMSNNRIKKSQQQMRFKI